MKPSFINNNVIGVRFVDLRYFLIIKDNLHELDSVNSPSPVPYNGVTDSKIDRLFYELNALIKDKEANNG